VEVEWSETPELILPRMLDDCAQAWERGSSSRRRRCLHLVFTLPRIRYWESKSKQSTSIKRSASTREANPSIEPVDSPKDACAPSQSRNHTVRMHSLAPLTVKTQFPHFQRRTKDASFNLSVNRKPFVVLSRRWIATDMSVGYTIGNSKTH
jgi:hypothetical protein